MSSSLSALKKSAKNDTELNWRTCLEKQNWREVASGEPIKNRDLWERLLDLVNEYASEGVQVRFWLVGHISNKEARKEARKVSKRGQTRKKYTRFPANGT